MFMADQNQFQNRHGSSENEIGPVLNSPSSLPA